MFVKDPDETAESEEETPEEETPEGSEEVTEEEVEEEEDTEESDEEEEDKDDAPKFFNPADIKDPVLLKQWKRMQASFTRGMQDARGSQKKAAAWDALLQDPQFVSYLTNAQNGNGAEEEEEVEDKDAATASVREVVRKELERALKPIQQRFQATEARETEKQMEDRARSEFAKFSKDYPDYEVYKHEMAALMDKRPGMTYEEAYRFVAFDDAETRGGNKALNKNKMSTKKRANVSKPGARPGEPRPKEPDSFKAAWDLAKRQLAAKGVNINFGE